MDLEFLEKAIILLKKHELSEISYNNGEISLSIKGNAPVLLQTTANVMEVAPKEYRENTQDQSGTNTENTGLTFVKSPLVGTFYRATDPNSPPLCAEGQTVKKGTPLGLVEAMKVLTMISAPCDGIVSKIVVSNGEVIEYDQILIHIQNL